MEKTKEVEEHVEKRSKELIEMFEKDYANAIEEVFVGFEHSVDLCSAQSRQLLTNLVGLSEKIFVVVVSLHVATLIIRKDLPCGQFLFDRFLVCVVIFDEREGLFKQVVELFRL